MNKSCHVNNKKADVIVSPAKNDEIAETAEDGRLMLTALSRTKTNGINTVSMSDVMKKFGITQEDLDNADVNLDI